MANKLTITSIDGKYFLPALSAIRKFNGKAVLDGKAVVLTMTCPTEESAKAVMEQAYHKLKAEHPYQVNNPEDKAPFMDEPEERARGRRKVEDKKGEAYYEHQDTIISGWELGTIAPPDLVTAEGMRGSTANHKLKPDEENARARQLARKAKQRKVKEMPDWIKDLM